MAGFSSATSTAPHEPSLLVGRDRERAELRRCLDKALQGHGGLVLVSGEAGIGKTTLVEELRAGARQHDGLVLVGHCYDLTITPPYGPWVDAGRMYQPGDGLPEVPVELRYGMPLTTINSQAALFEGLSSFYTEVAACRPLLLVLEDLHWADSASLELLRYLARGLARQRMLVVVTYRDDELGPGHPFYQQRPALVRESNATRVELRRLTPRALSELIRARYRLAEDDRRRLSEWLQRLSEGNPFYALELLRALEASAVLAPNGGGWALGETTSVQIPSLLQQIVDRRLDRLDAAVRRPLQIAAVIGAEVPFDLWSTVCGAPLDELIEPYERAREWQIVTDARDASRFRFTHALLRHALYDGVAALRRRSWHRRVAEALESSGAPDPNELAYHYQQAGDDRYVGWLVRAGDRAQRAFAFLTAMERYTAAVEALEGPHLSPSERGWMLFRLGSLHRFRHVPLALRYYEEASELAERAQAPALRAYAVYARGLLRVQSGDVLGGVAMLEAGTAELLVMPDADRRRLNDSPGVFSVPALPPFGSVDVPSLLGDSTARLPAITAGDADRYGVVAVMLAQSGQATRALDLTERTLAQLPAEERGGRRFNGHLYRARGYALALLGNADASAEAFGVSVRVFDPEMQPLQVLDSIVAELDTLIHHLRLDDVAARRDLVAGAHHVGKLAEDALPAGLSYQHMLLAVYLLDGTWSEAADLARTAHLATGRALSVHQVRDAAARLAYLQGLPEVAWQHIQAVLPNGPETEPGNCSFIAATRLHRLAVGLSLDAGQPDVARAWLEAHDRWMGWSGVVIGRAEGELIWARYFISLDDAERATVSASRALQLAGQPRQQLPLMHAHRLLGQIAIRERDFDAARQHFERANDLAARCELPFEQAQTHVAWAELALARGELDDARELLGRARSYCVLLDAKWVLQRIEQVEQLLAPRPVEGQFPADLSTREVEVLRLVARGLTDAQVGAELFISPRTVGQHLRSIYNKLGVSSRVAASRFAVDQGLA